MLCRKKNCTEDTVGKVHKVHFNENGSRRLTVYYTVNGITYRIKENVTVRSEAIRWGRIPIGQRKIEYIEAGIGETVVVRYNPQNPKKAYLKDNVGKYV